MKRDHYASITKVANGYTVNLSLPPKDKDDWDNNETYICATLDEALKKVEDYFTV